MEVEECFAPSAYDSDNESVSSVKCYVTQSKNDLMKENLEQVKEQIKKQEQEQVRYLSLDNAQKDLEIKELKDKIGKLENIVASFKIYEEVIKKLNKNHLI